MISSIKEIFNKLDYQITHSDIESAKFFNENGYCLIKNSKLIIDNLIILRNIVDNLITKESWRGGWEGKEEYLKLNKTFNKGAHRLANLFNKNEIFFKIILEENILKITYEIMGDNFKIGALDMREPIAGTGFQEIHIDWIPKEKSEEPTQNIVAFIFLDDSNEQNGVMRLIPKTHKKCGWVEEHLDDKSSHPNQIYPEVEAGDIILMDANLWHSGSTNLNGKRRRVLYLDIRKREIPQLLNQRIYLDEETQSKLGDIEKFLLGLRKNDSFFEDRVFTAGNIYRKKFNIEGPITKEQ